MSQHILIRDVYSPETENPVQIFNRIGNMTVKDCLKEESMHYKQIIEDLFRSVSHPWNNKDKFWFESVFLIDALGHSTEGHIVVNTRNLKLGNDKVSVYINFSVLYFMDKLGSLQFTINDKNISEVS